MDVARQGEIAKLFVKQMPRVTLRSFFYRIRVCLGVFCVSWLSLGLSLSPAQAAAGINQSFNYQARLLTLAGNPVPDGSYNMQFSLYGSASGGTPLYTSAGTTGSPISIPVNVSNGLFSVLIGDVSSGMNPLDIDWNQDSIYLGVKVGTDGEMIPRKRLSAVPYAFNSDSLQGNHASSSVDAAGGSVMTLHQASTDAAVADRTALFVQTNGTSDANDYLIKGNDGSSDVFTLNRAGSVTTTGDVYAGNSLSSGGSLNVGSDAFIGGNLVGNNNVTALGNMYVGTSTYGGGLDPGFSTGNSLFVQGQIGSLGQMFSLGGFVAGSSTFYNDGSIEKDTAGDFTVALDDSASSFQVEPGGSGFPAFVVASTSNVGIGTANPTVALDVNGDIHGTGEISADNLVASNFVSSTEVIASDQLMVGSSSFYKSGSIEKNSPGDFNFLHNDPTSGFNFYPGNNASPALTVASTSFIGIGVSNPTVALDVNGDMHLAGQITVDDFVSSNDASVLNQLTVGGGAYVGTSTYDGQLGGFANDGKSLFVASQIGSLGAVYTNDSLVVQNSTFYSVDGIEKGTPGDFNLIQDDGGSSFNFFTGGLPFPTFTVASSGFVGIGVTAPTVALDVNGDIHETGSFQAASDVTALGNMFVGTSTYGGGLDPGFSMDGQSLFVQSQIGALGSIYAGQGVVVGNSAFYDENGLEKNTPGDYNFFHDDPTSGFNFFPGAAGTPALTVASTSFVGIGVANPTATLDVGGDISARGDVLVSGLVSSTDGSFSNELSVGGNTNYFNGGVEKSTFGDYNFYHDDVASGFNFYPGAMSSPALTVASTSFVGIGVANPTTALDVGGDIQATGNILANGLVSSTDALFSDRVTVGADMYVGTSTYGGGLDGGFDPSGNGLFVQGQIGSMGQIYSSNAFVVGNSTFYADGNIEQETVGDFNLTLDNAASSFNVLSGGAPDPTFTVASSGNVGIGITSPSVALDVGGFIHSLGRAVCLEDGTNCPTLSATTPGGALLASDVLLNAADNVDSLSVVALSGKYAYVGNAEDMDIVDVTSSTAPQNISRHTFGDEVVAITVAQPYAYVETVLSTYIVDISNPASPVVLSQMNGIAEHEFSYGAAVSGKYLYRAVQNIDDPDNLSRLEVIDVSNPNLLVMVTSTHLSGAPDGVVVANGFAYVIHDKTTSPNLTVLSLKDPATPKIVGTATVTAQRLSDLAVSGRYVYVLSRISKKLNTIDISNPISPLLVNTYTIPFSDTPVKIAVAGTKAYVTTFNGLVLDISLMNPIAPVMVNSYDSNAISSFGIAVDGRYAYTTDWYHVAVDDPAIRELTIFDVGGLQADGFRANTAELASLHVLTDAQITSNLSVGSSLFVGSNGILSDGPLGLSTTSTNWSVANVINNASNTVAVLDVTGGCGDANGGADLLLAGNKTDSRKFSVRCNGDVYADGSMSLTPGDYAEYFRVVASSTPLTPGDVVALDETSASSVTRGLSVLRAQTLGIISTKPAIIGNSVEGRESDSSYVAVALLGQVPAHVSAVSSTIYTGDDLMMGEDGMLTKAIGPGMVVGRAMEPLASGTGTILVSVSPHWWAGDVFGENGDLSVAGRLYLGSKSTGVSSTSTYLFVDDTVPGSTFVSTNADGFQTSSTYDYAERYSSKEELVPGDLVAADGSGVNLIRKTSSPTDIVLGIVSTRPGFVTGAYATGTYPIALAGRVPTKVSAKNGSIQIGDPLMASDVPGTAVKSDGTGSMIGVALESYQNPSADGLISVFVKTGWQTNATISSTTLSSGAVQTPSASVPLSGLAKVFAGATSVKVSFPSIQAYPVVQLTPNGPTKGGYWYSDVSDTGFTIVIGEVSSADLGFSWTVQPSVTNQRMSFSDNTSATYDPQSGLPAASVPSVQTVSTSTSRSSTEDAGDLTVSTSTVDGGEASSTSP